MISVNVLSLETQRDGCVILLEEDGGPRLLPIIVGFPEGNAIALKLGNVPLPRPMSHDLMVNLIKQLDAEVLKVVVSDLQDNTFFAYIHLKRNGQELKVDSRPSDAIALARRASCPIFVEEKVFGESQPIMKPITKDEVDKFKEEVKNMSADELMKRLKGEGNDEPGPEEG